MKEKKYQNVTLSLERETLEKLPNHKWSKVIRKLLRDYTNTEAENIEQINIEVLITNIKLQENELSRITSQYNKNVATLKKIQQQQEEKRLKELEKEREKIEAGKKCINCGKVLEDGHKFHKFEAGKVCNVCFMSSTSENYKEWNTKV